MVEGHGEKKDGVGNEEDGNNSCKNETHEDGHLAIKGVAEEVEQDKQARNDAAKEENKITNRKKTLHKEYINYTPHFRKCGAFPFLLKISSTRVCLGYPAEE